MADEQKPKERKERKERKKVADPATEDSILTTTAKAIGTAAGKIASLAGVTEPAPAPPHTVSTKQPKLQKKISTACRAGRRKPNRKLRLPKARSEEPGLIRLRVLRGWRVLILWMFRQKWRPGRDFCAGLLNR